MLRCGELMILPRVSRMLRDESTDLSPFFSAAAPTAPDASSSAFIPLMLSVCGSKRSLCQSVSCAWLAASWLLTNSLTLALGSSARAASFCIDSVSSAARPTQAGQHATDGSTAKVRGRKEPGVATRQERWCTGSMVTCIARLARVDRCLGLGAELLGLCLLLCHNLSRRPKPIINCLIKKDARVERPWRVLESLKHCDAFSLFPRPHSGRGGS